MRALTSVQSASQVLSDLEFRLTASDQSTTWLFGRNDIEDLTQISWEVAFGGGFGKTSNYTITLTSSIEFIKEHKHNFSKGEASLKVYVNSDNFTPHVGRVRDVTRDGSNPDVFSLLVFDKFFDSNPKFPAESIVDSYTSAHPEVVGLDMGYPVYYGKHTRPFYMTAVDCDISTLLGPRNVSSENHVTSLWFNTSLTQGHDTTGKHIAMMHKTWGQESGGNAVTGGYPFEVHDVGAADVRVFKISDRLVRLNDDDTVVPKITNLQDGVFTGTSFRVSVGVDMGLDPIVSKLIGESIKKVNRINFAASWGTPSNVTSNSVISHVDTGGGVLSYVIDSVGSGTHIGSFDVTSTGAQHILSEVKRSYIEYRGFGAGVAAGDTLTTSISMSCQLYSGSYRNYSVFGTQVNCSDIAVSENPIGIAKDIMGRLSVNYVTSQASQSQADTSSYNFQCLFAERRLLTDILNDIGEITSTYLWVGDSGYISLNTYQESSASLAVVTITTSDMQEGTFKLMDNPLGTTVFNTVKAKRIKVNYGYNYTTGNYELANTADPLNNAFCNSAQAAGIDGELEFSTKYIMESATSSMYVANVVRKSAQDEQIVEFGVPARFMGLELADVMEVQHPSLVGSSSLFQITRIKPNYFNGGITVKGNEVQNL